MNGHIVADDAALYALGALDESARASMDGHVTGCAQCSRVLGSAEDDVARMAAAERSHEMPTRLIRAPARTASPPRAASLAWAGLAAVVLLAMVPSAYLWQRDRTMHAALSAREQALSRLAGTNVRSATFTTFAGGASARVMYAPDGSWYVVIVRGASNALDVAWMHEGQRTLLGTAQPYGDVAMLYLPKSHRMDQLALVDGQRVVAEAQLAY